METSEVDEMGTTGAEGRTTGQDGWNEIRCEIRDFQKKMPGVVNAADNPLAIGQGLRRI